jgi:hypothetical protein
MVIAMTDDDEDDLDREDRRTRVLREAREIVKRHKRDMAEKREKLEKQSPDEVARTLLPLPEDRLTRWRREMSVFEAEREAAEAELITRSGADGLIYKRYEGPQPTAATPAGEDWNAWADARIDARLEEERKMVMDIVGECVGELLAKEREATAAAIRDQVRELKIEATSLRAEVIELRTLLALERGKVVDQTTSSTARRVN